LCKGRDAELKEWFEKHNNESTSAEEWVSKYDEVLGDITKVIAHADPALAKLCIGRSVPYHYFSRYFDVCVETAIAATKLAFLKWNPELAREFVLSGLGGKIEESSRVDDLYAYKNDPKRKGGPLCCFNRTNDESVEELGDRKEAILGDDFQTFLARQCLLNYSSLGHEVELLSILAKLEMEEKAFAAAIADSEPNAKRIKISEDDSEDDGKMIMENESVKEIMNKICKIEGVKIERYLSIKTPLSEAQVASDEAQLKEREALTAVLFEGGGKKLGVAIKMVEATIIKCASEKYEGKAGNFAASGPTVFDNTEVIKILQEVGWASWFNEHMTKGASEYGGSGYDDVFGVPVFSNSLLDLVQNATLEDLAKIIENKSRNLTPFRGDVSMLSGPLTLTL
jgi:hypothetical protein